MISTMQTFKNYLRRLWLAVLGKDKGFQDVRDFHIKFGQLNFYEPGFLTRRKLEERARFLQEELNEFLESKTLDLQADALIDLVYVAMGTGVMMGIPWEALWDDVQRANMAKVRGTTHRGNLVDVCKPPGWVPPQGAWILALHSYDPFMTEEGIKTTQWSDFPPEVWRDDDVYRSKPTSTKNEDHGTIELVEVGSTAGVYYNPKAVVDFTDSYTSQAKETK